MPGYIDPHIHMISRVTDDYQRLAYAGCRAVSEPAFWAGFDRGSAEGFRDYFRHLTEVEPKRAAHVLGIGEIGLNKNTKNECTVFLEHLELAATRRELVLIHTPHLEDKHQGTRMILDMLRSDGRLDPGRVCVDHVEEHTVGPARAAGFWCGMTLYPVTKCTPQRAADIVERFGPERLLVNSAGDWGKSDPLAVPEFIQEMKRRGHAEGVLRQVGYENPPSFFPPPRPRVGPACAAPAPVFSQKLMGGA